MKISRLNHRATKLREERTADGMGGYKSEWKEMGQIWVEILVPHFSRQVLQGISQSTENVQARIRKFHRLQENDRLQLDNGKLYKVLAIDDTGSDCDIVGLTRIEERGGG